MEDTSRSKETKGQDGRSTNKVIGTGRTNGAGIIMWRDMLSAQTTSKALALLSRLVVLIVLKVLIVSTVPKTLSCPNWSRV